MNWLKIWSGLLGNLFEHYDTALYALLSPFIAPLFFPQHDPVTALILTYGVIPMGMLARPLGAFVFGYIGDSSGRHQALFISLVGMAMTSFCMGFIPVYNTIGIAGPVCLIVGRIFQNLFGAGETMGGAVYVMEHTPEERKDLMSSCYSASTVGGDRLGIIWSVVALFVDRYHQNMAHSLLGWLYHRAFWLFFSDANFKIAS